MSRPVALQPHARQNCLVSGNCYHGNHKKCRNTEKNCECKCHKTKGDKS